MNDGSGATRQLKRRRQIVGCAAGVFLLCLSGCGQKQNTPTSPTVKPTVKPTAKTSPANTGAGTKTTKTDHATKTSGTGGTAAAQTGILVGVITYQGTAPKPKLLVKKGDTKAKDAAVCALHDVPDDSLKVNPAGNGVADVFVYLSRAPKGATVPPVGGPVEFDQKGCRFTPHAMVVRLGQTILVKSDDPIAHNTHTNPLRNNPFNQTIQPNDRKGVKLVYEEREPKPVRVKCDIHPWMSAYQLPLNHPFAAVTDATGHFQITGLPAGKQKLRIWHEKADYLEKKYEVDIKPGQTTKITLSFPAAKFSVAGTSSARTIVISSANRVQR